MLRPAVRGLFWTIAAGFFIGAPLLLPGYILNLLTGSAA